MLVHSLILRRLPALLLLAVDSSVAVPPVQGEQLARRQPFSKSHAEDGSQGWAERGAQKPHAEQRAIAVHKMMDDEAEMFFPDYWAFDQKDDDWAFLQSESEDAKLRAHSSHDGSNEADIWANASLFHQFEAPIALHRDTDGTPSYAHWARGLLLHDRAFHCPNGTDDCAGINRPNSCCPSGASCQLVTDTGNGDVACCGSGQTCSGNVQHCAQGYQSCPGSAGGGCCVPGYACVGTIGCTFLPYLLPRTITILTERYSQAPTAPQQP